MNKIYAVTALACAAALSSGRVVPDTYPTQFSAAVGVAPDCPYGYFDYAPYDCAPYGYYGPDWFIGGAFIGAGPWFHGPGGFYGHVDNRFDPHNGYRGPLPNRGDRPFAHFHANEARDGRGHVGTAGHDGGGEHIAGAVGRR
jgi:hypothetical protein